MNQEQDRNENYTVNGHSLAKIRNKFEVIVINYMRELIPKFAGFDNCKICIKDVYALSLSRIPSTYVIDNNSTFDNEMNNENIKEIVSYSLFQVMSKPKHAK